jgi:lipoprotein-anchoring transpeptidase ErfK/SrfK
MAMKGIRMRFILAMLAMVAMAPMTGGVAAAAELVIAISKAKQEMTVNLDGDLKFRWPISTGARGYDTPSGSYRPFRLEAKHFSKEWDDAPMPHSIFFTGEGHAIHGSFHTRRLGQRASHGCVRLAPANAAKLFALVRKVGLGKTRVEVGGGGLFDWGSRRSDLGKKAKKKGKNRLLGGIFQ